MPDRYFERTQDLNLAINGDREVLIRTLRHIADSLENTDPSHRDEMYVEAVVSDHIFAQTIAGVETSHHVVNLLKLHFSCGPNSEHGEAVVPELDNPFNQELKIADYSKRV